MMKMMQCPDNFTGPVNLGNPGEFTILELAQKVIELIGSSSKIVHLSLPDDDPTQRRPDITLAQKKLGWQPTVDLAEGLQRTIGYFRNIDLSRFHRPTDHTAHKSSNL